MIEQLCDYLDITVGELFEIQKSRNPAKLIRLSNNESANRWIEI
nr:hypothetical protein [Photobacterium leiognathi]